MGAAPKSKTVTPRAFALCSSALTNGLAKTGARALAVALVRKRAPRRRELAGASLGASVAFTNLCIALAEAPVGAHMHELDVAGVGRVSWKAAPLIGDGESDLVVFALHDEDEQSAAPGAHDEVAVFR
jgi:hypothetical protein